ncbi:M28 family peptidase [Thalassotalea mangrovi]|uniref:M28 family peptidase n=1 Tax=Thalassotalea mangrovi TaxID=2572245 RepID=A0A4U1B2M8_9GAMM|nr:M28 family peptidase [Thalassotalea mangrovi]TKB43146.1 M28 family peptidase [Thalassotalea mangrovi]
MIEMKKSNLYGIAAVAFALTQIWVSGPANAISVEQVRKDVSALAGDDTLGRAADGTGIAIAEQYIRDEFKAAGLQPFFGQSYLQTFSLYHYQPRPFAVAINGQALDPAKIFAAGSAAKVEWQKDNIAIIHIGAEDDFRAKLKELNEAGENALVLVNPVHEKLFKGFSHYLATGTRSLSEKPEKALVFALSETPEINRLSVTGGFDKKHITLNNVAAVLEGKSRPDEYVVFSAHHDHIGQQIDPQSGKDNIYNGANDDASGVAAVLNLARYFNNMENRERSILFITFTAEELGLLGSEHFAKTIDADAMVAMFNIEMIGKASQFGPGKMWMTGMDRSNLGDLLNTNLPANLRADNYRIEADPYPDFQLFYRSDNASLARLGVPAHSISSTQIAKDQDYHQVSDEISTLDLGQMTEIIKVLSYVSKPIITGVQTPERIKPLAAKSQGHFF